MTAASTKKQEETFVSYIQSCQNRETGEYWHHGLNDLYGLRWDPADWNEETNQPANAKPKAKKTVERKIPISHYALNGYKLSIPQDRIPEVYTKYAECIARGEYLYLCEVPGKYSKLGFDLDIDGRPEEPSHPAEWPTPEQAIGYVRTIQQKTLKKFYPNHTDKLQCVILIAQADAKNRAGMKPKIGAHPFFYNLVADADTKERIWAHAIQSLISTYGERPAGLALWEDVLDPQVFRTSLRMIGSRKMVPCPNCNAKKPTGKEFTVSRPCPKACGGTNRKIDEGRPYQVYAVLDSNGNLDTKKVEILKNMIYAVQMATLWVPPGTRPTPVTIPPDALLADALRLMEDRPSQISVLPVVEGVGGVCLGLLRLHDIYRAGSA